MNNFSEIVAALQFVISIGLPAPLLEEVNAFKIYSGEAVQIEEDEDIHFLEEGTVGLVTYSNKTIQIFPSERKGIKNMKNVYATVILHEIAHLECRKRKDPEVFMLGDKKEDYYNYGYTYNKKDDYHTRSESCAETGAAYYMHLCNFKNIKSRNKLKKCITWAKWDKELKKKELADKKKKVEEERKNRLSKK